MHSEFVSFRSTDGGPVAPLADQCCRVPVEWISRPMSLENTAQQPYVAEASVTISATGGSQMNGIVSTDPGMAVILVALAALSVVAMSLYVVRLVIKGKKL